MLRRLTRLGRGGGRGALEKAQRALAAHDPRTAAAHTEEAFERLHPDDGASWLHLGDLVTMLDRLETAQLAYERAAQDARTRSTALARLAALHLQQGRGADAEQIATAGLEAAPRDPMLRWLQALGVEKTRGAGAALELLLDLAHDEPEFVHTFRDLGRLSAKTDDVYACIEAWQRVVELAPDDLEAQTALGIALTEAGEDDYGVEVLQRVVAQKGDHPPYVANLGLALFRAERHDEALEVLERATTRWPNEAHVLVNLGVVLEQLEHFDRAVTVLRRAVDFAPDFAPAHFNLGHALSGRGETGAAALAFARAAELAPDDPEILAARPPETMDDSLTGTLSTLSLDALVELIRARRTSGRLMIVTPDGEASAMHLVEGRISSAHAFGFDLVERIVRSGLAPPGFLDRIEDDIDPHRHPERVGALLIRRFGADHAAWRRVLLQHTEDSLARMLHQRDGRFTLVQESFPPFGLDADPRSLVAKIRSAQTRDLDADR